VVPYVNVANYALSTLPLFLLMGVIIRIARLGEDLYDTAYKWVGQLRGGLAIATVLACTVFAAITGASTPALIAMGKIALPQMRRYKYADWLATGCIACAGNLAILIPPSLGFILYGIMTEQSVGALFMAGVLPGVLLAILFMTAIMGITTLRPQAGPPGPKTTFKTKIVSVKNTWHVMLLVLLILGGIYGGVFTPTEAGAVGAFGAIVIAAIGRRLTRRSLLDSFVETGQTMGIIVLLIVGAFMFAKFVAVSRVAIALSEIISQLSLPTIGVFACIILVYILIGMFMDIISGIIITLPILYPIAINNLGFDPIWYGVVTILVIQLGVVTPPIGLDVFVLSGVTGVPAGAIFRGIVPFCIAILVLIVILTIFPQIALFLPNTMLS
jgi:tripartite ATP-independent transporter DctM subunit